MRSVSEYPSYSFFSISNGSKVIYWCVFISCQFETSWLCFSGQIWPERGFDASSGSTCPSIKSVKEEDKKTFLFTFCLERDYGPGCGRKLPVQDRRFMRLRMQLSKFSRSTQVEIWSTNLEKGIRWRQRSRILCRDFHRSLLEYWVVLHSVRLR